MGEQGRFEALTLELCADVADELEALTPALAELVDRANALLAVVTWDDGAYEGQPEPSERLYGALRRLHGLVRPVIAGT